MVNPIKVPSLKPRGTRDKDIALVFESVSDFTKHCRDIPGNRRLNGGKQKDDWVDSLTYDQACDMADKGDMSRVPASDALMEKLEDTVNFDTKAIKTIDAMVGGVPNVGAFLAGSPINMRRRQRVESQGTPLNVFVDLTSSAYVTSETLARRGTAILAFVRIMATKRPVNLYIGCAMSPYTAKGDCNVAATAVRLDTSPLDLARASFAISGAAFPRNLVYSSQIALSGCDNSESLPWPYEDTEYYRKRMHTFWGRFLSLEGEDTVCVAPLHMSDTFAEPEKWLRDMLAKYAVQSESEAA